MYKCKTESPTILMLKKHNLSSNNARRTRARRRKVYIVYFNRAGMRILNIVLNKTSSSVVSITFRSPTIFLRHKPISGIY